MVLEAIEYAYRYANARFKENEMVENSEYTFVDYMRDIDEELEAICGMSSNDLADWMYRDAYDGEMSAGESVIEVLRYNGYPSELLED